jgi:hypothetical protein
MCFRLLTIGTKPRFTNLENYFMGAKEIWIEKLSAIHSRAMNGAKHTKRTKKQVLGREGV